MPRQVRLYIHLMHLQQTLCFHFLLCITFISCSEVIPPVVSCYK
jgi:hypothetical protein